MKKVLNRKGFTLIELLAVIIILAVIMVFAVPAIMETSNTAQRKSFQLYAQRVLTKATEYVETQKMLGYVKAEGNNDTSFYTIEKTALDQKIIGLGQSSGYGVCIEYIKDQSNDAGYTLKLYITNGTYCYSGYTETEVSSKLPDNKGCKTVGEYGVTGGETKAGGKNSTCMNTASTSSPSDTTTTSGD